MCKALAGSGRRVSGQVICRHKLALQHRWGKWHVGLGLTLLSCAGSRGRFGDDGIPMSMSFGTEAEGAARASAGVCSMLIQK